MKFLFQNIIFYDIYYLMLIIYNLSLYIFENIINLILDC
jgi:hypothetical protein